VKIVKNLYLVQDNDRPLYVLARTYGHAVSIWKNKIAKENDIDVCDVEDPVGVNFICSGNEVLNSEGGNVE